MEHTNLRVLHVVECFAGGAKNAVLSYIASTPELTHVVLASYRGQPRPDTEGAFRLIDMCDGHRARIRQVSEVVDRIRPDVVHAHSSFAGVYCRLSRVAVPIVYTPHSFSFERQDLRPLVRLSFRTVEKRLASRTALVAACSEREAQLARELGVSACVVPNIAQECARPPKQRLGVHNRNVVKVVFIGRLTAQKDPEFAVGLVRTLREGFGGVGIQLVPIWIGGGSAEMESLLGSSGITVSGWLTPEQVEEQLHGADVYVHTAKWEGFPISILEAHQFRLPIVARSIPALADAPREWKGDTANQLSEKVLRLVEDPSAWVKNLAEWDEYLAHNDRPHQRAALISCYRSVTGQGKPTDETKEAS